MKSHMELGAKALRLIKDKDKKMRKAILKESEEVRVFDGFIQRQHWDMERRHPYSRMTSTRATIHVFANQTGFAVRVDVEGQQPMIDCVAVTGSSWFNTLRGIVAGIQRTHRGSSLVLILSDRNLAEHIRCGDLEKWHHEGWVHANGEPRKNTYMLDWVRRLLAEHDFRVFSGSEVRSPKMKLLATKLEQQLKLVPAVEASGHN